MTCDYSRRARILNQVLQVLARDELVNYLDALQVRDARGG